MDTVTIRGARDANGIVREIIVRDQRIVDRADPAGRVIEADGLMLLPGLVDIHTHLREPGFEDSETIASGTRAAARGGFTAVFAMANLNPVTDSVARVRAMMAIARRESSAQVFPIAAITKGLEGRELSPIADLATAGVTMFSDDGKCVMNAQVMRRAFEEARASDALLAQHSQDHNLAGPQACADEASISAELGLPGWPGVAESVIIARDVQLAELTGGRIHCCHITTAESVEVVRWAKGRGIRVSAEVTPHHLLLGSEHLRSGDTTFKVNPPLRGSEDVEALRAGLAEGVIDLVGTDHAPHDPLAKAGAFPDAKPGMIGLEQALAAVMETMVLNGRMTWVDVVRVMSTTPAQIGRARGHGGSLSVGDQANLVLIDPSRRAVVDPEASYSKARNNPYAGMNLPDPVVATMCNGRFTYNELG